MSKNKEEILTLRSKFSPAKQTLLAKRLRGDVESNSKLDTISRRSSTAPPPLSFAQQRLWFLQQLEPNNHFYNEHIAIQLTGSLDVVALEQSLNKMVQRHEVLRTTFKTLDGRPVQIIAPKLTLTLPVVDLYQLPEAEQKREVQRLSLEQSQRLFDLVQGPLLRCALLQLGTQKQVLLFTMHHTIFDGWSGGVIIRELSDLYQAFSTRKPTSLPELPIQYADFTVWQRQELQGKKLESQLSYWKEQLENAPPLLQLPTDRPRPPAQTYRGAKESFRLPKILTQNLKAIGTKVEATLFMTLLSAFKILLYRYSGEEDIIVGSPIANRNTAEIEGLIGCFVNTLVLRTDFSGNPTFEELLGRVQKVTIGAYANQDLPFETLVDELQLERDANYNPLFQVSFVLQNTPKVKFELPGLTLTPFEVEHTRAMFDLSLDIEETELGLEGFWEYNTDLFDAATISRMRGHFQTLLEAIAANPQQRVSQLSLSSEAQQHQLLVEWNDTESEYLSDKCIYQLFETQVEKTPDAVAVVFEDQQLTYQELNVRANQLAHHLQYLGIKPDVLVGLCVERSLEMVIGLLGILKAGGAYLPLDPVYPKERLAFMLTDAQVPVLLTQQPLLNELPEHQAQIVCLDTDWTVIAKKSQENPVNQTQSENLAYLIYTSGSTGTPKGVMIQHHSLVNYTEAACLEYELVPSDRILQFASISFDAAAEEIFPCLVKGATLVLRTDEMLSSIANFLQTSRNLGLTVLDLPTAFWHQLTAELSANLALPKAVRLVIIGGEKALPELLETWKQQVAQQVRLVNSYGPTETTIVATICELSGAKAVETVGRELPIGKALQNIQTYVLDSYLQPVAIAVPGELYIGGLGVARGYLNRPELTAEKFIPNPFIKGKGEDSFFVSLPSDRLYKTGDLVRYRPDGNLEYLGRIDAQVKIRGFRIELGEIEAALSQHPAVRETVVLAGEKVSGGKRLVAYIVTEQQLAPSIRDLRHFLKEKLPEYMVPSVFVQLEALPLTPNGKVDRKALPATDTVRPELDKAFVAPRTPIETKLVEIWSQVLGVEQVGIYDNFFELGGDSILTIQIIARANQTGLLLTPKQLFKHQNIAELAAVTVTKKVLLAEQGLVTGVVFLTPIQKWFFEQNLPAPHHFNQAVLLEVRQAINLALLEKALQHLLLHHDALRLRFEQTESGWQAQSSPDVSVPLARWDFSGLAVAEQTSAIDTKATELQASLNLSTGLLVRVGFFDLGVHQTSRLLIVIHHLVVDGVSWRILLEDLQTAYQQLSRGEQVQLPAKTTSCQYLSQKLREYARSTSLQQELDYWLNESRKESIPLTVDFPEGENTVASVDSVSSTLSFPETQALFKEVPKAYNTQLKDILLTALVQAFSQWTGERVLLLDLEGHG
ncbi:MAG: amino acid adenylation domain-containing protein, partial [Symploca sp. SIO2G7]|nr:amino acid adenylation domain-containing protein [Symploca sp. SIO2G7]